jgi:hypothetical protein
MDKETMETQRELIMNFLSDTNMIPDFINSRKYTGKKCFDISHNMFMCLRDLLEPKVLEQKEVSKIYNKTLGFINDIFDLEPIVGNEYFIMIKDMLEFYKNECISLELYETAENLTRFINLYEKIKK